MHLSESSLNEIILHCEAITNWSQLIRTIGSVFHDPESLVNSFLKSESPSVSKEELRAMEVDMDKDMDERAEDTEMDVEQVDDQSPSLSCADSPHHAHVRLKEDEVSVDVDSLRRVFTKLFALSNSPFQNALSNALRSLSRTVEMELKYHQAYERNNDYLNIFIIVFELLVMDTRGDLENATNHIFRAAGLLPLAAQAKLARVWAKLPYSKLKELLGFLHQIITLRILSHQWSSSTIFNDDTSITGAAKIMKIVYYASILGGKMAHPALLEREKAPNREIEESLQQLLEGAMGREKDKSQPREDPLGKELAVNSLDCRRPVVPWEDFVNDLISDGIRMEKDYANYKGDNDKFSFLMHPFLLTTAMKNLGMYYDSKIRMVNERRVSLLQSLVNGAPTMPYLRIRIRRDHIIDDALVNVSNSIIPNLSFN
jgi:ubiquitin-protein ligase E3 A